MNTHTALWQRQLVEAFSSVEALCRHLEIDPTMLPLLPDYPRFPLRVPRGFVDCMQKGNPADPLLRQVLPTQAELQHMPGDSLDPVGDLQAVADAGVIHKYQGRILLISTGACAVHCRYCFRRNFPYNEIQLSTQKLNRALTYISAQHEIEEVILSGGDPLLLNDEKLDRLLLSVGRIDHVKRIRIHSRMPIVLPARITDRFLETLSKLRQQLVVVLHANHPAELSPLVGEACQRLRPLATLLNQSVLLKHVNDDHETLCRLSEKLFRFGVLPYYLHSLDRAAGVSHFEVAESEALTLMQTMQSKLPGYLVPRFVKEEAGAAHKIRLA